jgi:membrane protein YqaA with SNARE-associated domain
VHYHLQVWAVLFLGVVAGSILGRYLLTVYIPLLMGRYFNVSKNEDVRFLGEHLKDKGLQRLAVIVAYSLLPLPTTPLFLAAGMARIHPLYIIPAFFVGKLSAVALGKYASQNQGILRANALSWQSIAGLGTSLLLLLGLLFIDWRALIQKRKFTLVFNIFK